MNAWAHSQLGNTATANYYRGRAENARPRQAPGVPSSERRSHTTSVEVGNLWGASIAVIIEYTSMFDENGLLYYVIVHNVTSYSTGIWALYSYTHVTGYGTWGPSQVFPDMDSVTWTVTGRVSIGASHIFGVEIADTMTFSGGYGPRRVRR